MSVQLMEKYHLRCMYVRSSPGIDPKDQAFEQMCPEALMQVFYRLLSDALP